MKYFIMICLLLVPTLGFSETDANRNSLLSSGRTNISLQDYASIFIFGVRCDNRWVIDKNAIESMTTEEIENFIALVKIFSSGVVLSPEMEEIIINKFIPERFKEGK